MIARSQFSILASSMPRAWQTRTTARQRPARCRPQPMTHPEPCDTVGRLTLRTSTDATACRARLASRQASNHAPRRLPQSNHLHHLIYPIRYMTTIYPPSSALSSHRQAIFQAAKHSSQGFTKYPSGYIVGISALPQPTSADVRRACAPRTVHRFGSPSLASVLKIHGHMRRSLFWNISCRQRN